MSSDNIVPMSPSSKKIHIDKTNPDVIIKIIPDSSATTANNEIEIQTIVSMLGFAPNILYNYWNNGATYIAMTKIKGMTLADFYGSRNIDIPTSIWNEVRKIVQTLYNNGIEYVDITPYNFMIDDNEKIWIIDFEHAKKIQQNWFLNTFLNGANTWNPDFA